MKLKSGKITDSQAREIGNKLGINFKKYDINEFKTGLQVELEHSDITHKDGIMTGKIAYAHLREEKDYYKKLTQCKL